MSVTNQKSFISFLENTRIAEDAIEKTVEYIENVLPTFLRSNFKPDFKDIYSETDHHLYDDARKRIFLVPNLKAENSLSGDMISRCLKLYSDFLQSKFFKNSLEKTHSKPVLAKPETAHIVDAPQPKSQIKLKEGSLVQVRGSEKHERNKALRDLCIAHYGYVCQVCGFDFVKAYGELGKDFIEVHHLTPISTTEGEHEVDPITDLIPLCSNCHSMIHRGEGAPLTLEEMREAYIGIKWNELSEQTSD